MKFFNFAITCSLSCFPFLYPESCIPLLASILSLSHIPRVISLSQGSRAAGSSLEDWGSLPILECLTLSGSRHHLSQFFISLLSANPRCMHEPMVTPRVCNPGFDGIIDMLAPGVHDEDSRRHPPITYLISYISYPVSNIPYPSSVISPIPHLISDSPFTPSYISHLISHIPNLSTVISYPISHIGYNLSFIPHLISDIPCPYPTSVFHISHPSSLILCFYLTTATFTTAVPLPPAPDASTRAK